jgi:tape measure domain-containing protein
MTTKIYKTKEAEPLGQYAFTAIDASKDSVGIRLLQVSPMIVDSKIPLKGRGIVPMLTSGRYQVSKAAWEKLKSNYTTTTDF